MPDKDLEINFAPISSLRRKLLVDDVQTESISNSLHFGDQVAQVLDGLDLLLEEGSLQEVGHLGVVVLAGSGVDFQARLFNNRFIFIECFQNIKLDKSNKTAKNWFFRMGI